jgi:hypothetical protein
LVGTWHLKGCPCDYVPRAAVLQTLHLNLAKDTANRGAYAFTKRWPGPVAEGGSRRPDDPDGVLWRTLDPERSVLRCGFATPDYVLGSAGLDARWLDDTSMGFRWQGVVFASDPLGSGLRNDGPTRPHALRMPRRVGSDFYRSSHLSPVPSAPPEFTVRANASKQELTSNLGQ